MNIHKTAIKSLIWSAIQNWGSQAGSLIIFFVLARLLSPADFGLVALANTFLAFFNILMDQGLSSALIQRHKLDEEHLHTAFWAQACIGLGLALVGFNSARLISDIFQEPLLTPILKWFSILFIVNSLNTVQQSILIRNLEFRKTAFRSLLGIFLSGVVGISMALIGYGVWSLVGLQLTYELVGLITFWSLSCWQPKLIFSLTHFKDLSYL